MKNDVKTFYEQKDWKNLNDYISLFLLDGNYRTRRLDGSFCGETIGELRNGRSWVRIFWPQSNYIEIYNHTKNELDEYDPSKLIKDGICFNMVSNGYSLGQDPPLQKLKVVNGGLWKNNDLQKAWTEEEIRNLEIPTEIKFDFPVFLDEDFDGLEDDAPDEEPEYGYEDQFN